MNLPKRKHYTHEEYLEYATIVLANGAYPQQSKLRSLLCKAIDSEQHFVACCDGAVNNLYLHTQQVPDLVVGDLDSVGPELRALLGDKLVHIAEQETNDLSKTIRYIHQTQGKQRIVLLGATGKREDHTLGNISLLPSYAPLVEELVLLSDTGYFRLITSHCSLEVKVGTQLSFFAFGPEAISVRGVQWPIEQMSLPYLWSGTLNRACSERIEIDTTVPILVFIAN